MKSVRVVVAATSVELRDILLATDHELETICLPALTSYQNPMKSVENCVNNYILINSYRIVCSYTYKGQPHTTEVAPAFSL